MADFALPAALALVVVGAVLSIGIALRTMARGPTQADRVLALEILLAGAIALAIAASVLGARTVFLDVGIGLALVGFVATIGWARLLERSAAAAPQLEATPRSREAAAGPPRP